MFTLQCVLKLPDCVKCVRVFNVFFVPVMGTDDDKHLCFGDCH